MQFDDLNDTSANPAVTTAEPLKLKMMRDLARLVLFAYVLLVLNPVMPIVADIVAHTFWEKEHLLTVHEVNGKYHVHFDLIRNAKQADKDKSAKNSKADTEEYLPLTTSVVYTFPNYNYIQRSYAAYKFHHPVSYLDIDDRPPQLS